MKNGPIAKKSRPACWSLYAAALILLGALGILIWPQDPDPAEGLAYPAASELLPDEHATEGWARIVRPVAETPEIQARVDELLNFSDAVFVDFVRGLERVSVYIAYWEPKRMSQRDVAGHYPDTCWTRSGWSCLQKGLEPVVLPDGRALEPMQRRLMEAGGGKETVYFWHLVQNEEGGFYAYRRQSFNRLRDVFRFGINQKRRQYFIRISSNRADLNPLYWINERFIERVAGGNTPASS